MRENALLKQAVQAFQLQGREGSFVLIVQTVPAPDGELIKVRVQVFFDHCEAH